MFQGVFCGISEVVCVFRSVSFSEQPPAASSSLLRLGFVGLSVKVFSWNVWDRICLILLFQTGRVQCISVFLLEACGISRIFWFSFVAALLSLAFALNLAMETVFASVLSASDQLIHLPLWRHLQRLVLRSSYFTTACSVSLSVNKDHVDCDDPQPLRENHSSPKPYSSFID